MMLQLAIPIADRYKDIREQSNSEDNMKDVYAVRTTEKWCKNYCDEFDSIHGRKFIILMAHWLCWANKHK